MRHRKGNKKLSRPTDQRIALLRGLVRSLLIHRKIQTTDIRAKEAKKIADKVITLAKEGSIHSRREALKILPDKQVVSITFNTLADQYKERNGGYTRIIKLGPRKGDAATISLLELVE